MLVSGKLYMLIAFDKTYSVRFSIMVWVSIVNDWGQAIRLILSPIFIGDNSVSSLGFLISGVYRMIACFQN